MNELWNISWMETASIALRLLLATVCSGVLGFDRERKKQAAGFRTHMVVGLASTLVMLTNIYVNQYLGSSDLGRMPAAVITGLGFLGAGAILVTKNQQVRGLTTAAGLWAASIVGIALGAGFYAGGLLCFLFLSIGMRFLNSIDQKLDLSPYILQLYGEFETREAVGRLLRYARDHKMQVRNLEVFPLKRGPEDGSVGANFSLITGGQRSAAALLEDLSRQEGFLYIDRLG